ncbi:MULTISPECIES: hypothetical protein [unclassified Kitasatospora]|uniref:hypothetical protein n=1 Tax=unclassified Kitasatospora TaxID=2633591 RepID=UPI0033DC3841
MKATKTLRRAAIGMAAGVMALVGTMASAGTAQAATGYGASLSEPGILYQADYLSNGDTRLIMQGDGNLVLYRGYPSAPYPVWSAPGSLGCGQKTIMQGDGNVVVYGANNRVCWASNTFKDNPNELATLGVADRGGLVVTFVQPPLSGIITATLRSSDPY